MKLKPPVSNLYTVAYIWNRPQWNDCDVSWWKFTVNYDHHT